MQEALSSEEKDSDFYLLKNYQDPVFGTGFITYLGDGVLRSDFTWTYLEDDSESDSFFSAIVNYDYSWFWLQKDWYGFVEFYYNGLGSSDVFDALKKEALRERLARGEIFVTGNYYVNCMLQYEAHPLVNIYSTLIYNLEDNSFLFQPRLSWDLSSFSQLLFGFNISVGSENSEFGQHHDPHSGDRTGNASQIYLVFTCYF